LPASIPGARAKQSGIWKKAFMMKLKMTKVNCTNTFLTKVIRASGVITKLKEQNSLEQNSLEQKLLEQKSLEQKSL
jgi:hypothetical protein